MVRCFENQDAINSANKLLEDIRSTRDKEFSRLYVNSHKCDSPLSYCSINPSTLTVISLTESMVDTLSIEKLSIEILVSIYLKDNEPHANPIPGIYIASKEFPKELI